MQINNNKKYINNKLVFNLKGGKVVFPDNFIIN